MVNQLAPVTPNAHELRRAVLNGLMSDGVLPVRVDENAVGGAAGRLAQRFERLFQQGQVGPRPATFAAIGKTATETRPVALVDAGTRLIYETLFARLGAARHADRGVRPSGPRAITLRSAELLCADALVGGPKLVVITDIKGLGTDLSHDRLLEVLRSEGADAAAVDALGEVLAAIMGGPLGLPQCLPTTRRLVRLLLGCVDRALLGALPDVHYRRVGDDFAVGVRSEAEATKTLDVLAEAASRLGLGLHPAKTGVFPAEEVAQLAIQPLGRLSSSIYAARVTIGRTSPPWMTRAVMDLYWTGKDRAEVHRTLAEVVALPFEGQDVLVRRRRNASLRNVLRALNGMRDPFALPYLPELLAGDSAPLLPVARYLSGLYPTGAGEEALAYTERALTSSRLRANQKCWMVLALETARRPLPPSVLTWAADSVDDPDGEWVLRVAAARLLASHHLFGRDRAEAMWALAPAAGEADVLGAAALAADQDPSLLPFLSAHGDHPVSGLVMQRRGCVRNW